MAASWNLRIVGHDRVSPDSLTANPYNHRRHPQVQRDAVAASIRELGFIRSVTVNKRTGNIVDGHERVWQALQDEQPLIDVEYVDLSEEQERLALAVLDKTTELAEVDPAALDALLREIETGEEELQSLLAAMAAEAGMYQVGEAEMPGLASGDREPFQQMTFTLADAQAETVKRAMNAAKSAGPFSDGVNENSNGNALARIAEAYLGDG